MDTRRHTQRPPYRTALALAGALPLLTAAPALAAVVSTTGNIQYSTSLSSLPQNSSIMTFDLGAAGTNGLVSQATISVPSTDPATGVTTTATVSFAGKAGVYSGAVSGTAAAPWTPAGADTRNYLAAQPSGSITMTYASATPERYFGLLWGSVDTYNTLTFYSNGQQVAALTGSNITANANGSQGSNGSYFVGVNFVNGTGYDKVVVSTTTPAFEFDTIQYSKTNQGILPAPLGLAGATPAGMVVLLAGVGRLLLRRRAA